MDSGHGPARPPGRTHNHSRRRNVRSNWTTTRWHLQYHWKALLFWGSALLACLTLALSAWAGPARPYCADWDEEWFHHLTTVAHVRSCLAQDRVNINQQDAEGRPLLIRLAVDIKNDAEGRGWRFPPAGTYEYERYEGNTRRDRMALVRELLLLKP